jgi:hypothetical protein
MRTPFAGRLTGSPHNTDGREANPKVRGRVLSIQPDEFNRLGLLQLPFRNYELSR